MMLDEYLTTDDLIAHEVRNKLKAIKVNNNLSRIEKIQLLEVILNNMQAFQWTDKDLGGTKLAVHEVKTGDAQPVVLRQYQLPNAARESLLKQADEMIVVRGGHLS